MNKKDILAAFDRNKTDKGTLLHGYHVMYEHVFSKIGSPTKMLEIGVLDGRSLAAWCELFPEAEIVGSDIKQRPVPPAAERVKYIVGSSMDSSITELVGGGYDLIIDDGDHRPKAQWATFLNLQTSWTRAYVIEDVSGKKHVDFLINKLKAMGFNNTVIFSSRENEEKMKSKNRSHSFSYFSIVVYR